MPALMINPVCRTIDAPSGWLSRSIVLLLAAGGLGLALSSGSSIAIAKAIRYATQDEPQTLDPHSANLAVTNRLLSNVYEGLVGRDKDFKIVPWLALSWEQRDPKTWRFKLRPDVKFHDGSPFTADDVVFSVSRALHPLSQMKVNAQGVERARKIDDLTVEMQMREPNPVLPNHLFQLRIMSRAWAIKHKAETPQNYKDKEDTFASRNTNGTGPFMVRERQPDVKTVLVANPNWWNKNSPERGNVTEVTVLPIKSNPTRIAALISNEVQFVNDPPPQDVSRLRSAGQGVKVIEGGSARIQYLVFDMHRDELLYSSVKGKNPWKDIRVRQAVAHAIDINAIRSKVMRNLSHPTGTIISPLDQGYSADADKRLPFDRAKAKQLLADAGYPNGFSVRLDCGANQPAADICQAVAPMLAQIGISVTPNIIQQSAYFPQLQKFDTSFYLLSWTTPTADALYTLQSLLSTYTGPGSISGDGNYGRYGNPKLDALIDRFKVEANMQKRNALIREALLLVNQEMPIVPLHRQIIPWAMSARAGSTVTAIFPPNEIPYFFRFNVK
jgi:peptide/nickel transport system substrate-binding protein